MNPTYLLRCVKCQEEYELCCAYDHIKDWMREIVCKGCGDTNWKRLPTKGTVISRGNGWGYSKGK